MTATYQLKDHANYTADDLGYLLAIGWSPAEIKDRWDQEAADGHTGCHWETDGAKAKLAATLKAPL